MSEVEAESWDRRQVQDLAPIQLTVTEHPVEVKHCPCCQTLNRGKFPLDGTSLVQYGAHLKGLMVSLLGYQWLPSARVTERLSDVLGSEISDGTLYTRRERCFVKLVSVEATIQ